VKPTQIVEPERIQSLNDRPARRGQYVLYWMQAAQRADANHALALAVAEADARDLPVVAYFGLTEQYPGANARHFAFMLQGLAETQRTLAERGIRLMVRREPPAAGALALAADAALTVVDAGYLRHQREWRAVAAARSECPFLQVETDVVVPVGVASPKDEFTAATFRPKIRRALARFFVPPPPARAPRRSSLRFDLDAFDIADPAAALERLDVDRSVPPVCGWPGGAAAARARLAAFVAGGLDAYPDRRNDPNAGAVSGLSPYLHFGQLSPLEAALAAQASGSPGAEAFLEELIVRRELAVNFVWYNPAYDGYHGLPSWARADLNRHAKDPRPARYTPAELERAATHDPYWNAAQLELVHTGKMHGYMRMYWGKKILEWSASPRDAFRVAVRLNDRYELDGRDPNGYAGVAWCFGKHDRPWGERPVFGKVRCMVAAGLKRKFDADGYAARMRALAGADA